MNQLLDEEADRGTVRQLAHFANELLPRKVLRGDGTEPEAGTAMGEGRKRSPIPASRRGYAAAIWLKRSWGGEIKNVAVLIAIGVDAEEYREILGVTEGTKEDAESWRTFLRHLKDRGLKGVKLFITDKCLGLVEALAEFYPDAAWQRCVVGLLNKGRLPGAVIRGGARFTYGGELEPLAAIVHAASRFRFITAAMR